MTPIATLIEAFLDETLARQRGVSAAYTRLLCPELPVALHVPCRRGLPQGERPFPPSLAKNTNAHRRQVDVLDLQLRQLPPAKGEPSDRTPCARTAVGCAASHRRRRAGFCRSR